MIIGYLPSSDLLAIIHALLCISKIVYRIVNEPPLIGEVSQELKSNLTRYPRLYCCKFGAIMESKVLHASKGFRLFKSVFRLKRERAQRAFCPRWSSKRAKFPVDEMQVTG